MRRELARLLPNLAFLALLLGGQRLLSFNAPHDLAVSATVSLAAWILAAIAAGTVAHELGHARRCAWSASECRAYGWAAGSRA
jgi:hypothetical protein